MNVAKVDLGEKRTCPECESKFYDLTKNPAVCPKCGHTYDPETVAPTIIADVPDYDADDNEDEKKAKTSGEDEERYPAADR